ncbi:MAG TPA: hypothetical protein EYM90_01150 [Phycisphaerales bacterium]|nr:hypothetical protein [Phycisphaerales bacterium]
MSHLYLLGVATLTLTSAGFAGSDTNADLQARLEAAEARINELSVATNNNWLNDARSDEIRSLVHDVLADADTRASLQGSGSTAGYNGGFTVGSADGNWSLTMNGLLQTSWSNVDIDTVGVVGSDGWGFNNPNSWMNFSGTIAGDYSYDVRYNWDTATTEWANGSFDLGDGWGMTMGTFKVATNREDMIDDQYQLNLLNQVTGTAIADARAYTVGNGIQLGYSGDEMRFWASLTNLAAGGPVANDSQNNVNLRLEYMVEGTWSQFDQFTSANGGASGTLIGVSYNTVSANAVAGPNNDTDGDNTLTIDAQLQFGGSNLYVSYSDFSDDDGNVVGTTDFDRTQIMYGMYLNDEWEVYARYVDRDTNTGDDVLSIGLNNYWAGQNARWTTEITWDDTVLNTDTTVISSQLQFYF